MLIKDLSKELDTKAMTAVVGGEQVNGATQMTVMNQNVANTVGNGLASGNGPISVVSHINTSQTSAQYLGQGNFESLFPWFN